MLDGFALAQAIRQEEAMRDPPRTRLIAVTADVLQGEDARVAAAGLDGFLPKPLSLEALARALGRSVADPATETPHVATALFDPRVLHRLFGANTARHRALLQEFVSSAARDIAAMQAAEPRCLTVLAHRLKGAARMAGAGLLAEQASLVEAAAIAGDAVGARKAANRLDVVMSETLQAMAGS